MRDENKALWREISRLGGRVPAHVLNTLSSSNSGSSLGTSSSATPKLHIGGDDDDDDVSDEGFSFNVVAPGLSGGPGDAWMNWATGEMRRERRKVEKLTGIVRALCDTMGTGMSLSVHSTSANHICPSSFPDADARAERIKRAKPLPIARSA
jgi:hypothetical protein